MTSRHTQRQHQKGAVLPVFLGRGLSMVLLVVLAALLIYQYWYGENGRHNLSLLQKELQQQQLQNEAQLQKNARLLADVKDLKSGLTATEEHARVDLGLIKAGETFVQLSTAPTTHRSAPAQSNEPDAVEVLDVMVETPTTETQSAPNSKP